MSETLSESDSREERLNEIIAAYLQTLADGRPPDHEQLLVRYPELDDELRQFFHDKGWQLPSVLSQDPPPALEGTVLLEPGERTGPGFVRATTSPARHIRDYELIEEIGRGGMGVVYKARQTKLKRLVALKMILVGGQAGETELARFRSEAEAVARVQHPNIVQIHEVGEHEGLPFLSLEFCAGGSLADRLDGTPWKPDAAAELVETLARAMEAAHRVGVVHRDLKPANVLLAACGLTAPGIGKPQAAEITPKVTDFGLAKLLDEGSVQTQEGAVLGTPSYMAPEQAGGKVGSVGPPADLYALGAILYELLVGRPPFRAATPLDTILQVVRDEPVPPRQLNPGVPHDLETIALKCLEKDPAKRYASAGDLAEELRRYRAGEPILARPVGRASRAWRWCKRNPMVATLSAAVVLALLAGTMISTYFAIEARESARQSLHLADDNASLAKQERNARAVAEELAEQMAQLAESETRARTTAEENEKKARQLAAELSQSVAAEKAAHGLAGRREREALWNLYVARLFPMQAAWEVRDFGQLERLLEQSRPNAGQPDFRGWEWYYFQDQCRQASTVLAGGPRGAWCRKTGRIAVMTHHGKVEIWGPDQAKIEARLPLPGKTNWTAWSPDGTLLACNSDKATNKLTIWDVAAGKALHEFERTAHGAAWTADSKRLATGHAEDGRVKIWDVRQGRLLKEFTVAFPNPRQPYYVWGLAWHPDGVRLAAVGRFGFCQVWDTAADKRLFSTPFAGDGTPATGVAWSPDGKKLAVGATPRLVVYDEQGRTLFSGKANTHQLEWSPDGKYLVSGGDDQEVKVWDGVTGEVVQRWRLHGSPVHAVAWSPDGTRVLSGGHRIRISRAVVEEDTRYASGVPLTAAKEKALGRMAWSPDGELLACSVTDGGVRVYEARTGRVSPSWKNRLPMTSHYSVAWSRDSAQLVAVNYRGNAYVCDREGKVLRVLPTPGSAGIWELAWSPDGKWLATAQLGDMQKAPSLWAADSWRREEWGGMDEGDLPRTWWCLSWSPDSRYLAGGKGGGGLTVWDHLKRSKKFHAPGGTVYGSTAWSPDGRLIAAATREGHIAFVRASDGGVVHAARGHTMHVSRARWSPDGRRIASCGRDGTVKIWDAATGVNLVTFPCDGVALNDLTWSPDGRRLACTGEDGALRIWGSPDIEAPAPDADQLRSGVLAAAVRPPGTIEEVPAAPTP